MKNKLFKFFRFAVRFIQLVFAWIVLHTVKRDLLRQNIWLICEKRDEARDNGYHFYKYLKENQKEINVFYVLTSDSPDRKKIEKYGDYIEPNSFCHCIYFLAAIFSISSQPYGAYPFHFSVREMKIVQKLCNRKQKVVFLQHGIIKDKLPTESFSYELCNIDYFVTSSQKEYEFVKEIYKYPDHAIGCVGLARFDYLYTPHTVEDKILVMPTWRKWLDFKEKTLSKDSSGHFYDSDYYLAYKTLLTDEALIQHLRKNHYKLVFYMHYKLQPYVDAFRSFENDVIIIADKTNYDVQELLMSSKLMVTDYSSVYFDFAYMNKPVAYYQFDKEQFRKSHYYEGYFSYENDGFGPCFDDWQDLRQYIFNMIEEECSQPQKYDLRVKNFFDLRDNRNCERTYSAIRLLEG